MSTPSGYSTLFPFEGVPTPPYTGGRPLPSRGLRELVTVLWRQWPLITVCTVVLTAGAWVLHAEQPRIFTSSAKVWVQTEQQGSPSFLSGITAYRETPYPDPVNRKIETEIELMMTRTNAQAVVERLAIDDGQLARSGWQQLRSQVARRFGPPPVATLASASRGRTVDLFLEGLSIEPLRSKTADTTSNVLEVRFDCTDPQLAPRALQAFLDNYLQLGAQQNRRLGETTSRLLGTKLAEAKAELRKTEDDIVSLLLHDSARGLPLVAGVPRAGAGTAGGIAGAVAGSGAGAVAATSVLGSGGLRLDTDPDSLPAANPAQVVAALKTQALDLQLRLDEARQLYTDDAEGVRNLRSRLDTTRRRLVTSVRENTQLEAQLNRLERQRTIAQDRYVELQRKLDQIDLYLKLNPTEAESRVIIDAPYKPGPGEGRKRPVLALAGPVAGLLLGLLLAFLRELAGGRLRSADEAETALGVPVLGALPTFTPGALQALRDTAFRQAFPTSFQPGHDSVAP